MTEILPYDERVQLLRGWISRRKRDGPVVGAKHPTLCLMVPEMKEAWPGLKAVAVNRPLDDVMRSLKKATWTWKMQPAEQRELLAAELRKRDADLARLEVPTLALDFADVVRDPHGTIDKLCEFAGIQASIKQREAAAAFVDPKLNHHTKA